MCVSGLFISIANWRMNWGAFSPKSSRVRNIWFLSPLVLSKWENLSFLSLYTFWGKCVYFSIFEWYNSQLCQTKHNCEFYYSKIYNCVKQNIIVYFIFQKLKNKHTFPKEYTNWAKLSSLNLTEREETKTKYFAPKYGLKSLKEGNSGSNWTEANPKQRKTRFHGPIQTRFYDWLPSATFA